jgi:eukaryotic-like serine/threonine-protein kinase
LAGDVEPEVLIRRAAALAFAVVIGLLAWLAVRHLREEPLPPAPLFRLSFQPPPGTELGWGDDALDAAISPDETHIAFVATTGGVPSLWLKRLSDADARPLPGTEGARLPAWKRGGRVIAFFAGGKLKQTALADGATRELADAADPRGAAWLPDGSLLFAPAPGGPLQQLRHGIRSDATTLLPGDQAHLFPASSGDDLVYVAVRDDGTRIVRLRRNAVSHDLAATSANAAIEGNRLLHVRDGVLVAQPIDGEGAVTGRATAVATSVGVAGSGHAAFAASGRLLVAAPSAPRLREIVWFDEAGRRLDPVGEPGDHWQVRLSPDDRDVAMTTIDPLLKTLDVVIVPAGRPGDRDKLTLALAADSDPVWSPDGRRAVFRSMEDGVPKLFLRTAHDPAAALEILTASSGQETPTDWRGRTLLVTSARPDGNTDLNAIDLTAGTRTGVAASGFNESDGRWSPDGAWTAYVSDESGEPDVYAARAGARSRVSFAGGTKPRWSADGRSLYFLRGTQIMRSRMEGTRLGTPSAVADVPGIADFDTAHRSSRLLVLRSTRPPTVAPSAVVNW